MTREAAVLVTLVVYKLVLIGIGILYQRRTHDGVDFYLAGRNLPPLVTAISASASSSSAWTLLGVSGAAYGWGLSAIWLFPSCVGGFLLNWYVLAPALQRFSREQDALTVTDILAGPSGSPLRNPIKTASALIILASLATYVASQFQGAGKTFSETFDISLTSAILIGAAVVVFYTLLGGFWAVSVTDTLQGLIMAATSVILPIGALTAVGGFGNLVESFSAVDVLGYQSLIRDVPLISGIGFVLGLFGIGLGYPGQPHVVNRYMALEDKKGSLERGRRIAIAWAVVVYSGMLIVGWCGRLLFPSLADPEVVFVSVANELFHPVLSGVMLAAVLSAIMSTADSQLLVASSAVTHDLNLSGGSRSSLLFRSRIVVLLLSAGAVVAALYGSPEIFNQVLFAWAAMGCAFGPPLLVTVLRGQVSARSRLAAILAGSLGSVTGYYVAAATGLWQGSLERVLPFLAALAITLYGLKKK